MEVKRYYAGKNNVFTGSSYSSATGKLSLKRKKRGSKGFFSLPVTAKTVKFPKGTKVETMGGGSDSKGDYLEFKISK